MKLTGYLVFKKGLGLIEFQFLPAELIKVQGELFLAVLMHPLQHQVSGNVLQPVEFPA